ncbi:MAG: hypothetical protein ACLQMH_08525 [Solirubrobacteraceae bacterium]
MPTTESQKKEAGLLQTQTDDLAGSSDEVSMTDRLALEMKERLVHAQYDLIRNAVRSAVLVDVVSRESTT